MGRQAELEHPKSMKMGRQAELEHPKSMKMGRLRPAQIPTTTPPSIPPVKTRLLLILVALLLALPALLHAFSLEENIELNRQGGCRVSVVMRLPDTCLLLYKAAMRIINEDGGLGILDEKGVRSYFDAFPEMKLESYHTFKRKGETMVQLQISAPDAQAAFATGALGRLALTPSKSHIGDTEMHCLAPRLERQLPELLRQRADSLATVIGGIRFIVRLATPTALLETSGKKTDYNRCSWEMSLDDLLDNTTKELSARW